MLYDADEGEIAIIMRIAEFPRVVHGAASAHEPHRIAFFMYELASALHAQWNRGKELPHLRFIDEKNPDATSARLAHVERYPMRFVRRRCTLYHSGEFRDLFDYRNLSVILQKI